MLTQKADGFIFGLGGPLHSFLRSNLSFVFSIHDLSAVLVTFPHCDPIPGGKNLRQKGFLLAHNLRGYRPSQEERHGSGSGHSWDSRECDVAGFTASTIKTQRGQGCTRAGQ